MKFIEIMLLLFFLYSIGFIKAEATEFYNSSLNSKIEDIEDRVEDLEAGQNRINNELWGGLPPPYVPKDITKGGVYAPL